MTDKLDSRRKFLVGGAIGGFAVLGGASVWSLAGTLAPNADTLARSGLRVDLSKIAPGEQITLRNAFRPLVIIHLSARDLAAMEAVDLDGLRDHHARNLNVPQNALATSANRRIDHTGHFAIYEKLCTHFDYPLIPNEWEDQFAWFCPLCGSRYDVLGRVTGYASRNLPIPRFASEYGSVIRLLPKQLGRGPKAV